MPGQLATLGALICLLASAASHATVLETRSFNGNTYHLLSQSTWLDAETEAQSLGGHLVTVNNQAEQDFLWNTFSPLISSSLIFIWIGYNDIVVEGEQVSDIAWGQVIEMRQ